MPLSFLTSLLALLFPSRCVGCRRRGSVVCVTCQPSIPWLGVEVCPTCATPSRLARICHACVREPLLLDGVRSACRFEGIARAAIHDLKFRRVRDRAPMLGDWIAKTLDARPVAVDLLVPIPITPVRRRDRGFNQSALIAERLGERLSLPVVAPALDRIKETPPQVRSTREERQHYIRGAFACRDASLIAGRRIGLVDDVMTTGSTLNAAAEALKASGAARVYGLSAARTV